MIERSEAVVQRKEIIRAQRTGNLLVPSETLLIFIHG